MKTTKFARWIAIAALATGLAATSPALADDTLDRGLGSEWSSLDPQVNFDANAGLLLGDVYEGLVTFGPGGKVLPGAAESWDMSEDGLTYTFHLREGLKWSNGDPLVAQDFVNSVLRTLDPDTVSDKGYYFYSVVQVKGAGPIADGETDDPATLGVTAPDDKTLVIELDAPAPHILEVLGSFQIAPLHSPSYDEYGTGVFIDPAHVVSNGPYVIKEVVPQSHVLLEKNPNYWDAANVSIPFVKYLVTEDVSTELKRYQAGEIDITYDIPSNQIDSLMAEIPDQVFTYPVIEVLYYTFNLTHEALQDINVREALALAIDRDTLLNKIVKSGAVPSFSYAGGFDPTYDGPLMPGAELTQEEREAKAKELMAAAGYGPENPLKINIVTTVSEPSMKMAQGAALMWKKVLGVEATVDSMEVKAWLDSFYAGTWDVFADDLVGDFAGAESFLAYMRPSSDSGYNWDKPEFDEQMDIAAAKVDMPSRNIELAKAEKLLLDDFVFSPMARAAARHLVSPHVHGFEPSLIEANGSQFLTLD